MGADETLGPVRRRNRVGLRDDDDVGARRSDAGGASFSEWEERMLHDTKRVPGAGLVRRSERVGRRAHDDDLDLGSDGLRGERVDEVSDGREVVRCQDDRQTKPALSASRRRYGHNSLARTEQAEDAGRANIQEYWPD